MDSSVPSAPFVITNALLCDGSGNKPFHADVAICRDKIVRIAPHGKLFLTGCRTMDAHGAVLAPGFIDAHGHSDISLLASPEAFARLCQGVTAEVAGNCGLSPFPVLTEEVREHLNTLYRKYDVPVTWSDVNGYAGELQRRQPGINLVSFCGHNTLKANVCGYSAGKHSAEDSRKMALLLEEMLRQGACGLSSGLLYMPGRTSSPEELSLLMGVLKRFDALYATHLRNEGDTLEEALDEAILLAGQGAGRLQISHLKTAFPRNWHKLPAVLKKIEDARSGGMTVTADRYPDVYSQTSLSIVLPPPYEDMTDAAIRDRLRRDGKECERLASLLDASNRDWTKTLLGSTSAAGKERFCGMSIAAGAAENGMSPGSFVLKLLAEDAPGTMGAFSGMSAENMKKILSMDYVCCGTDESCRPRDYSIGRSHPRNFASFPAFFRCLRSMNVPLEKTVARMTSLPAAVFSIPLRGMIREGYFADMVLFDPDKLEPRATFGTPHAAPDGILEVFVNGVRAFPEPEGRCGTFLRIPRNAGCHGAKADFGTPAGKEGK